MTEQQHEAHARHQQSGSDVTAWEERYQGAPTIWSGRPNAQLVAEATELAPGRALDLGCGEGADAIWLATQGWQVTGVDWSTTALERAAGHAADAQVADRLDWVTADITGWVPPEAAFDLVTAHFLHPTAAERAVLLPHLAAAVAPGGRLLWVGHDATPERAVWGADRFSSIEELRADLPSSGWEVEVAEVRSRPALGHEGASITMDDVVLRLRRPS